MKPITKYRPVLTATDIETILALASAADVQTPEVRSIRTALAMYLFKIQHDVVTPSYSLTPKESLEDKLGIKVIDYAASRAAAFTKWEADANSCTTNEIELAMTHRYDLGMMGDEEARAYEEALMEASLAAAGVS